MAAFLPATGAVIKTSQSDGKMYSLLPCFPSAGPSTRRGLCTEVAHLENPANLDLLDPAASSAILKS